MKKNDLLKLCEKEIIPMEYHSYYQSLPTAACVTDRVPLPTQDEIENDTVDE